MNTRSKQRRGDIARDISRRYPVYTKYSNPVREERIAKELKQHKIRQNLERTRGHHRNRLVADAIAIVEDELQRLNALEKESDITKKGTKAHKEIINKEKKMEAIVAQRNTQLNSQSSSEAKKRKQRHLKYEQNAKEMIENVAVPEIRNLLTQEHIAALQEHDDRQKLSNLMVPIIADSLHKADNEEKLECSFCDSVHPSNRLRKEHTQTKHFGEFVAKALWFCLRLYFLGDEALLK